MRRNNERVVYPPGHRLKDGFKEVALALKGWKVVD